MTPLLSFQVRRLLDGLCRRFQSGQRGDLAAVVAGDGGQENDITVCGIQLTERFAYLDGHQPFILDGNALQHLHIGTAVLLDLIPDIGTAASVEDLEYPCAEGARVFQLADIGVCLYDAGGHRVLRVGVVAELEECVTIQAVFVACVQPRERFFVARHRPLY